VMLDGGLVAHHQHRRDHCGKAAERRDAERVLEDLRSLCRAAQSHDEQHPDHATLTGFLEHAAGLHAHELGPDEEDRRITVSTIHRAKGTEAQFVVLLACEQQLLPSWRALRSPDPAAWPRSAASSTSRARAPRTASYSPTPQAAAAARPPDPRSS
jgi:ATP-dependent DNA helicase UvrD/PcrA